MVRVAGVVLDSEKHIFIALKKIYGIGNFSSFYICRKLNIPLNFKVKNLKNSDLINIQKLVSEFELEGNLRTRIRLNVKRLKDIGCYRGLRHKNSLPVRGQRTRTNARTRKRKKNK